MSERPPSRGVSPAWLLMLGAALVVGFLRPRLSDQFHKLQSRSDVYALPAPEQTVVASLGYRSALADLIYGHVLVSYGLHFQEKRRFEFVGDYLDTINALDPTFADPYYFADTLLTLQPVPVTLREYEKAREVLERGMEQRPYDFRLWSTAGQFMTYLAPQAFKDPARQREWKLAGAKRLAKACELAGADDRVPYHCIGAVRVFSRAGQREAAIDFMQRVLAVSDNEEIRGHALAFLEQQLGERERERAEYRYRELAKLWDLTFITKDALLVIGPPVNTASCAGHRHKPGCETSWRDWSAKLPGVTEPALPGVTEPALPGVTEPALLGSE